MAKFVRTQLKRYTYFQQAQYQPVLDADGNPVIDEDTGEAETILAEPEAFFYGNFFPTEVEPATTYTTGLYLIDYNTQAAGKFKLWRANDYWLKISSLTQQTVTSPLLFKSTVAGTQLSIIGTDIKLFTDNYTGAGKAYYKGREIISDVNNDNKYYVRKFGTWTDLHSFVVQAVGTATDKWMSQNAVKLEFDKHLDLAGTKAMTGGIKAASNFYTENDKYGLHMNNSDIIGAHSIYFQDVVDAHNEGINFIRSNGNFDNIAALNGELYFSVNCPKKGNTNRLQYKVLTALNYNTLVPKLDGTGATGNWNINAASASKLNHNITINLTDVDNKNGVKGTVVTDFSGTTVNIPTEISPIDASKITSGIIDIERLPQGVLERLVPVANKAARFALTKAQVQNGDTVKQIDTQEMWYVVDDTKLNSDAGYEVYTSGRASSVPWTGVEGKPTQITLSTDLSGTVVLGAGPLTLASTIVANAVTNTKLADMAANTIKGRQTSAGDPQDLNPTQIRAMLNVADGANKYIHPAYTVRASGFYKFNVDATGHVPSVTAVAESDIMGLHTNHTAYTAGLYKITVNNKGHVTLAAAVTNADIMGLHSNFTARAAGFYKVTVDAKGHVSNVAAVTKADITGLGIPGSDTVYTHPSYTARNAGFYKVTVDALGHVSAVTAVTKADITGLGIPGQDTNTTYSNFTRTVAGLVPAPSGTATTRYLREDGTWVTPPNTTYGLASTTSNGLLRQLSGNTSQYMRGDGTWATPPNTTYGLASTSANGLLRQLNGNTSYFMRGDGNWAVPPNTTYSNFTRNVSGLIPAPGGTTTTRYMREDGQWVTPPDTNTTYGLASTTANGLLRQLNNNTGQFLRGDGTWATPPNTTYGLATSSAAGLLRQLSGSTSQYMRGDGTWATPPNTTYSNFTRTVAGLVPAPSGTATTRYLREDGTWVTPPNTTYGLATTSAAGLLPKLSGNTGQFLRGDGTWAASSVDLSNYVTLNSAQSITGKKTLTAISIGGVTAEWNGTEVGAMCFNYSGKHIHLRPAGQTTMDGSLYVAQGGYGSDRRFKTNITEIDTSKADLISFRKFLNTRVNKESAGVIAQELETVYPEFIFTDENSKEQYKYVDYNGVFSVKLASHDEKIKQLQNKSINIDFLDKLSIRSLLKLILLKILNRK